MLNESIAPETAERIDRFVGDLEERAREIAREFVQIPDTPDSHPEVLRLHLRYGGDLVHVSDQIEDLRRGLDWPYDVVRRELQIRL